MGHSANTVYADDRAAYSFKNQQFITRGARADRGSYFVTTYIKTYDMKRKRRELKKKRKKRRRFK